jgi:hypothetical protein
MVGLAKNAMDEIFTCDISPQKVLKTKSLWVEEQFIHLENKCHTGRSEPKDVALVGHSVCVKMVLERSNLDISFRHQ